jgi:hypothetical protein
VRQIRFALNTTNGFLDMSSIAFESTVTEKGGSNPIRFLGGNWGCMVSEMRIYAAGVECERIQYQNRLENMLERFLPWDKRAAIYNSGFGFVSGGLDGTFVSDSMAHSTSQKVVWKPITSGLLSQKCYLPSMFLGSGGLVIELFLVGDPTECCDTSSGMSSSWELTDLRCYAEVCSVDNAMLTSLSKALLNGTELQIPFKSYQTTLYSINAPTAQLVNARALTRVDQILLSFHRKLAETATLKELNYFYLSAHGQDISLQASIGERNFPDHKASNLSEHWYRLLNGLGVNSSNATLNISRPAYRSNSFVQCIDLEAVPGQAHGSGMSTHGAQMTFALEHLGTNSGDLPDRCYVTTWYNAILSIGQDGCTLAT